MVRVVTACNVNWVIFMRALKFGLVALAFSAGSAFAAPVVWTIAPTAIGGGTTVSGTFTFDSATSTFSNPNISATGTINETYTFLGNETYWSGADYLAQPTATVSAGGHTFFIALSGLPAAGGSYTSTDMGIITNCTSFSPAGYCVNGNVPNRSSASLTGQVAASTSTVPTLSEYGLMALASLVAMGGIWTMRKRGKI